MKQRELTVFADGFAFLEGPRWHDGKLWVSDFYREAIFTLDASGSETEVASVPEQPSGLGWLPDGTLLAVSMKDRKILRFTNGSSWAVHADLSGVFDAPLNDMVVDEQTGRLYVGSFGFDVMAADAAVRPTQLVVVEPDGQFRIAADGLIFPNGAAITVDGRTLLVGETFANRVSAFDIHPDGRLGERRTWADWGTLPDSTDIAVLGSATVVGPDGCALDSDGGLWVADCFHQRVVRVVEGGEITEEISTGDDNAFAVAIGGDVGRTLYICVAPNFYEHERRSTRLGRILSTEI